MAMKRIIILHIKLIVGEHHHRRRGHLESQGDYICGKAVSLFPTHSLPYIIM